MSSYLHNLTMRTLNLGSRVEPRRPSLFEATQPDSGPPLQEDEAQSRPYQGETSSERETTPREVQPSKGVSFTNNPPASKPVPEDLSAVSERGNFKTEAVSDESVYRVDEDPVEASTPGAKPSPSKEQVKKSPQVAAEDSGEERIVENSSSFPDRGDLPSLLSFQDINQSKAGTPGRDFESSPTVLTPSVSSEDQFQEPISFEKTALPLATNRIESRDGSEKTVPRDAEESENSHTTRSYRRLNPTPATGRQPREQPTHWRRRQSFGSVESEPSINVTIGRVEVRAIPADNRKTTSQPRSESPVMPLEDYLRKQRRGGER